MKCDSTASGSRYLGGSDEALGVPRSVNVKPPSRLTVRTARTGSEARSTQTVTP